MQNKYELWDVETGNWLEALDSAQDTSVAIREYLALNGDEYLRSLALDIVSGAVIGEKRREPAIIGEDLREWLAAADNQAGADRGDSHTDLGHRGTDL